MNVYWWLNLNRHNFGKEWRWLPEVKRSNWPIKTYPGQVWYVNFAWLNFGLNFDNEW